MRDHDFRSQPRYSRGIGIRFGTPALPSDLSGQRCSRSATPGAEFVGRRHDSAMQHQSAVSERFHKAEGKRAYRERFMVGLALARTGLGRHFAFYNTERPREGFDYRPPLEVMKGAPLSSSKWGGNGKGKTTS